MTLDPNRSGPASGLSGTVLPLLITIHIGKGELPTVHGADAAPLAAAAVVGTTGVFQHPEHALAVMAVNADAAAALGPTPHPTRRDPWLRAAARCRITVHDHLARIWEPRSRR